MFCRESAGLVSLDIKADCYALCGAPWRLIPFSQEETTSVCMCGKFPRMLTMWKEEVSDLSCRTTKLEVALLVIVCIGDVLRPAHYSVT